MKLVRIIKKKQYSRFNIKTLFKEWWVEVTGPKELAASSEKELASVAI